MLIQLASILDVPSDEDTEFSAGMHEIVGSIRNYCDAVKKMHEQKRYEMFTLQYPAVTLENDELCPICWYSIKKYRNIPCTHKFCIECLDRWFHKRAKCPMCKFSLNT